MRDMFGSYARSLKGTFTSERVHELPDGRHDAGGLDGLRRRPASHDPTQPRFWFRISLALMTGAVVAYPMNWWMVAHHLKHGMLTVRPKGDFGAMPGMKMKMDMAASSGQAIQSPQPPVPVMATISFLVLVVGVAIALTFGSGH